MSRFKLDIQGKPVRANAGVNVALFSLFGPSPGVINNNYYDATAAEANYLAARGVKYVRLPIVWEIIQPTLNAALDAGALASLKRSLTVYAASGISAIVDLHNFNRRGLSSTIDGATQFYVGSSQVPLSAYVDCWQRLSVALNGKPGVYGYDLMNEPEQTTDAAWVAQAQAAINAIRANGDTTKIIVEGVSSGDPNYITANPTLHTLADPLNKLEFSQHIYPVGAGDNASFNGVNAAGSGVTATKLNDNLSTFVTWCATHGVKGNVGEYGVGEDNQLWMTMEDAFLTLCETEELLSFFYYFGANGAHDENNIYPFNGIEPRQWAVMAKHNGASSVPITIRLTGPSTAYQLQAIPIVLDLRGVVPTNATWTFSDGGQGGRFTPASVSMTKGGFNFFPTIAYTTPGSDQAVNISATNDAGLANPAPLALAVSGVNPSSYTPPLLDGTASTTAFGFKNGAPGFVGGVTLTDFLTPASGTLTTDSTGLVVDKVVTPSTTLTALLPRNGPATIMIEVASFASASGAVIGNFVALLGGTDGSSGTNEQVIALVDRGHIYNLTSGAAGIAQPQRIVIAWDGAGIRGVVGGGNVAEVSSAAGVNVQQIGGRPDSPGSYFNHGIVAIAVWTFKGTSVGMRTLSAETT